MDRSWSGARLRELRQVAGMTQAALALASGCSQGRISDWESDVNEPLASQVGKIADALGVDPGELFKPASAAPEAPKRGRPPKPAEGVEEPRRHGKKR